MQIINLINQTGCKITTFPDGEKHVTLDELDRKQPVTIHCRITCADDLFCLMQVADVLKRQEMVIHTIFISYLMTARCDRLFDINRPFSLKLVADIINGMEAYNVAIIEPHSDRSLLLIKRSSGIITTTELFNAHLLPQEDLDIVVALPDKGAKERYRYIQQSRIPTVTCNKVRDPESGKLLSFEVETEEVVCEGKDIVLMDDLCDGGGTFLGLAPKLRELAPKSLSLLITHAIQLEGIQKVAEAYDHVYITDSFKDWDKEELPENVTVFKIFK